MTTRGWAPEYPGRLTRGRQLLLNQGLVLTAPRNPSSAAHSLAWGMNLANLNVSFDPKGVASMQRRLLLALVLMLTLLACTEANAAPFNYSGTTVGGPTWNRSLPGTPPTGLSGVGTSVPYDEFAFTVDASGAYNFLSLGVTPTNWDNFLALYQTAFSPLSPLTNAIVASDDFPSIGRAGFNGVSLTAGTQYFLITTGFANNSVGEFSNTITGDGNVTPGAVPEPASLLLLGTGLVGLRAWRKRRQ